MITTHPASDTTGAAPVAIGLIGAGAIGAFHGETLARRLPGVRLAGVADPAPGAAGRLAGRLGGMPAYTDAAELIADPDAEAIVIAAPARFHTGLIEAAAGAGKAVFCEKPMALTLAEADRAIAATSKAGVLQSEAARFSTRAKAITSRWPDNEYQEHHRTHMHFPAAS